MCMPFFSECTQISELLFYFPSQNNIMPNQDGSNQLNGIPPFYQSCSTSRACYPKYIMIILSKVHHDNWIIIINKSQTLPRYSLALVSMVYCLCQCPYLFVAYIATAIKSKL